MYNQILIATFTLFTLSACTGQKTVENGKTTTEKTADPLVLKSSENSTKSNMENENIVYFNEGENKFLKEFEMNVTFQKVAEDSRCPADVECVWAGVATVDVQLMGTYTRPVNVKLSSIDDVKKGYSKSAIFNGYKISLVELTPYPKTAADKKLNVGKHRIQLQIVKIAGNQIEMNTQ